MSEQAKSRFAIDLDDLEKQLKTPAPPAARGGDALAELARIVGRDDPLKGLFAQRQGQASAGTRIEPSFQQVPAAAASDNLKGALDEFDALLRRDMSARGVKPADDGQPGGMPRPFLVPDNAHVPVSVENADLRTTQDTPVEPQASGHQHADDVEGAQGAASNNASPAELIVDPFIDELDQHGRVGLDRPAMQASLDERRTPHDLDEPRHAGRPQRSPADDDLSRELDEQLNAYPLPPTEPLDDLRPLEPRKSRKGLITIAALLGVAAIGVVSATTFRSGPKAPSGEPPVIKAETGPNKVAPQVPGGTEVPNQNKQIYERGTETKAADTKVVTREEQPLDVAQAARTAARVILPGTAAISTPVESSAPAAASASPPPPVVASGPAAAVAPAASGLGEPRKVRTVSIRPDGTPATAPASSANGALGTAVASRSPSVPTMVLPPAAAPQPKPVTVAPRPTPKPTATDEANADAPAPLKIAPALPASRTKTQERAGERVASAPAPAASTTTDTARETPAATGATGGFAVQLGAPGSEAEARSTFAALQRKYPGQLGGQSPLIRKAEVNGREVYRLRVGPMSREGAASLCTQLQGAGGQCFIAKN